VKQAFLAASLVCVAGVAIPAQTGRAGPLGPAVSPATITPGPAGPGLQGVATQRAWLQKYCVGCHNTKTALPANDPVKLDTANLDDVTKDAATW